MHHDRPEKHQLPDGHGWRAAREGDQIVVLDRGAVRFDVPGTWFAEPTSDSMKVYDRRPPDDDCTLAVSYLRLPPVDLSGLPVGQLVAGLLDDDPRDLQTPGPVIGRTTPDVDLAWQQGTFIDPTQGGREAVTRLCLARKDDIQALLTFDFWRSDFERCDPVWSGVLESLRIAQWIDDPMAGPPPG